MKTLFIFFSFHFVIFIFAEDICEKKSSAIDNWLCENNQDHTVNVTYDCLHSNKPVEIWIWSQELPEYLSSLTIQNCEDLTLNLHKSSDRLAVDFRFLKVVNISKLTLYPPEQSGSFCYTTRCLPSNIEFANVIIPNLDDCLNQEEICKNQRITLKSLSLKNVSIDTMGQRFVSSNDLRQLIMDGVKIKNCKSKAFEIANKKATIKIINSEIYLTHKNFMECNVFEVIMSNNTVQDLNEPTRHDEKVFFVEADKITLTGNKMNILSDDTFKFTSSNIQITDNIFQRVEEKAFHNIAPTNSSPIISNIFNFSNNIIHSLAPGALMIPVQNTNPNALFTNITIFNNKMNCVCENLFWFEYIARNKNEVRNYFAYKWAKETNQNKCLNIPKCDVNQVLNNFHELCEETYRCPEMIISEGKQKVLNFINYNNEMGRETSKLLEILINQMGENKIFKDSEDEPSADQQRLLKKILSQKEQKWMAVLNFNRISSYCLVVITCLSCGVLFAKFLASSFFQKLISKYRKRSYLSETEMKPSEL